MADPLEGILDPPAPPPPPATEIPTPPDPAAALQQRNEELVQLLQTQGGAINELRAQLASVAAPSTETPGNGGDANADFWQDPTAQSARIAQEQIAAQVLPQAQAINEKLGRFAVQNFLAAKISDSFYAQVAPLFSAEVAKVPIGALGAAKDADVQSMLTVAWNAALGMYVQEQRLKRPAAPPNLGGGGSGGAGTGGKKTLAEVDPVAYQLAVRNGLSEETMQSIADEMEEENR